MHLRLSLQKLKLISKIKDVRRWPPQIPFPFIPIRNSPTYIPPYLYLYTNLQAPLHPPKPKAQGSVTLPIWLG